VHNILKKNGSAVARVAKTFPGTLKRGGIDRKILGRLVFGKPQELHKLEKIIHPLIRAQEREFLRQARKTKARAAILEIPLLFETGAEEHCDITLCVTAPRAVQKHRVLSRPGMTEEKLRAILARQMPNAEKCKRADYIVPTGQGLEDTERHLRKIFMGLGLPPKNYTKTSSCRT
jgi:dephospho-CoA kinase